MAFPYFSITQAYATIISVLNSQLQVLSTLCKNQTTGDFTDQVRYNSSTKKLESWTGSAWTELDISGATIAVATAATSARRGRVQFNMYPARAAIDTSSPSRIVHN